MIRTRRRFRLLTAYWVAARVLVSYLPIQVLGFVLGKTWREEKLLARHPGNARRVERAIVRLEGLFIKVGQLISMLSNFLPEEFRHGLEGLQDRVPARPYAEIEARLRAELGAGPEALFASFEKEPMASASLAQVHEARLGDGRRVAVKVQHLGIEETAQLDLAAIRRILAAVAAILRIRGLGDLHTQLEAMILEELDFAQEADHIEEIAANFEGEEGVSFPVVVRERSSRRVLTTELIDGVKITDLATLDRRGFERRAVAERVLAAYSKMIFTDGLYHADPHPGNLFVRPDGGIAFVDFGAVARLSPQMKEGIPRFLEGVLRRDSEKIVAALKQMGFVAYDDEAQVAERVIRYFQQRFLEQVTLESWSLADIHVDTRTKLEAMADLRKLDISFRDLTGTLRVPKEWVLLGRTLVLLLGLCTELDPTMNPMTTIRPYLEQTVLGEDRDWLEVATSVVKDMALTALTLPDDLKRLLGKADRGELEVRVKGSAARARLHYALGHQLLWGLLALGGAGLAAFFHVRQEADLAAAAAGGAGFFALCLGVSLLRARRWLRRL